MTAPDPGPYGSIRSLTTVIRPSFLSCHGTLPWYLPPPHPPALCPFLLFLCPTLLLGSLFFFFILLADQRPPQQDQ